MFARASCSLLVAAILASPSLAGTRYTVTDLGALPNLPHENSGAEDINNAGLVVGSSGGVAFVWDGEMKAIPGLNPAKRSVAYAINSSGDVAGREIGSLDNAFIYSGGVSVNLTPTLSDGIGYGINDAGHVVGRATFGGNSTGFFFDGVELTSLLPFGFRYATAINNQGRIVGRSNADVPILLSNGQTTPLTPRGDATPGEAVDINSKGWVAINTDRAYLYDGMTYIDIGSLGGTNTYADALNDSGQVVGTSSLVTGENRAFVFENGKIRDLTSRLTTCNTWVINSARGINSVGQIVGSGDGPSGQHAILLSPVEAVLPGDANDDGLVNVIDLNLVRNNFGGMGLGDANGDGIVNIADLNAVRNNFGASVCSSAVPEPSSITLLAITIAAGISLRARRFARPPAAC